MRARREGEQTPYWKRVEGVMKVQMGLAGATQIAREIDVSPKHYYRLEIRMLEAALAAVTPKKRGPKSAGPDPKVAQLEEKLRAAQRERELLEVKVEDLGSQNEEMKMRLKNVEGKKKVGRHRRGREARSEVRARVQADDLVPGGETTGPGEADRGPMPGDGRE